MPVPGSPLPPAAQGHPPAGDSPSGGTSRRTRGTPSGRIAPPGGARGRCHRARGPRAPSSREDPPLPPAPTRCQFPGGGGNTWLGARKPPALSPSGTDLGLLPLSSPLGDHLRRCLSALTVTRVARDDARRVISPSPLVNPLTPGPGSTLHEVSFPPLPPPRIHLGDAQEPRR